MSKEERIYLAAYLKAKDFAENSEFIEESSRRLVEMKSGKYLDSTFIRKVHQSLAGSNQ